MIWIQNRIVFFGSWVAVLLSVVWLFREGGYEPIISTLIGVTGIAANRDLLPKFGREKRNLTPKDRIALRDKWRPTFESYFAEMGRNDYQGDAIIHDIDRLDEYPKLKERSGISSWFRVGLLGTYNHGILVGLGWTYLKESPGGWTDNPKGYLDGSLKVAIIGEIPYESIESVNFDGDKYYNKPHIFCYFDFKTEPYERIFYGEEFRMGAKLPFHYREVAPFTPKRKRIIRFTLR